MQVLWIFYRDTNIYWYKNYLSLQSGDPSFHRQEPRNVWDKLFRVMSLLTCNHLRMCTFQCTSQTLHPSIWSPVETTEIPPSQVLSLGPPPPPSPQFTLTTCRNWTPIKVPDPWAMAADPWKGVALGSPSKINYYDRKDIFIWKPISVDILTFRNHYIIEFFQLHIQTKEEDTNLHLDEQLLTPLFKRI